MRIGEREIGIDHPPYVIAEIGVNHDGEVARALELTDAAADAGADAVKLQFFETDRLMSKAAKLAAYQKSAGETDPIEMLRRLELTIDEMALVVDRAHERGIHAIVTVFSTELVKIAETLAWDAYKTASPDIVNKPLLDELARTRKPMIVSTGASTLDEVVRAVGWLDEVRDRLAVLQCVSCYPAPEAATGGILAIAKSIGLPTGFSDHLLATQHSDVPVAAGACILEKHVTDDRTRFGPDHRASILVGQLPKYIQSAQRGVHGRPWVDFVNNENLVGLEIDAMKLWAREAEFPEAEYRSLGWRVARLPVEKQVLDCERDVREVSRQSVVSIGSIAAGTTIARDMLTIKRPGTGILAYRLDEIIGRIAARDIDGDVPITEEDLQ